MKRYIISLVGLWSLGSASAAILYVDDSAVGVNDGSSWINAYRYLQDALMPASEGDEIRVAQGVYRPDRGNGVTTGDREATFQLKNGVAIKGGYAGVHSGNPDERNIGEYTTILDGDLNGDGGNRLDNCFHVVTGSGTDESAKLEGFTLTNGFARNEDGCPDANGGGLYVVAGSGRIVMCHFVQNQAWNAGGGGGAVYARNSHIRLTQCVFEENGCFQMEGAGGGAIRSDGGEMSLHECKFLDNTTGMCGAAIYNFEGSVTMTRCDFVRNMAFSSPGGAIRNVRGDIRMEDCSVLFNMSVTAGGAIAQEGGTLNVKGCRFEGNTVWNIFDEGWTKGGAIYAFCGSRLVVEDSEFTANEADVGGAVGGEDAVVEIDGSRFRLNTAAADGGAIWNCFVMATLNRCVFEYNQASDGGAIMNWGQLFPDSVITNCLFRENRVRSCGGAIYNDTMSRPWVVSCTFVQNAARIAAGIHNDNGSFPKLVDCILWNNHDSYGSGFSSQIVAFEEYPIHYSCIQGWAGQMDGMGNTGAEPLFVDAHAGNFHLRADSPCIDTGDNSVVSEGATDLDGKTRIVGSAVDMGCYEMALPMTVQANVAIHPQVINRNGEGGLVIARVELPQEIRIDQVERSALLEMSPGQVQAVRQYVLELGRAGQKRVWVVAFFDKTRVLRELPGNGPVELTISGELKDGRIFRGVDTVRIIGEGHSRPEMPRPRQETIRRR